MLSHAGRDPEAWGPGHSEPLGLGWITRLAAPLPCGAPSVGAHLVWVDAQVMQQIMGEPNLSVLLSSH